MFRNRQTCLSAQRPRRSLRGWLGKRGASARLALLASFFILVLAAAWPSPTSAAAKRVLLLHSFGREFAPFSDISDALRKDLVKLSPDPIDLYEASIETARFREFQDEETFLSYLRALFAQRRLDLAITIGGPATRFVQQHRTQLFPSTPLLISATADSVFDPAALAANDAVVSVKIDLKGIVDNILQLLPETSHIGLIIGDSPIDRYWAREARRAWEPFNSRVEFLWLNTLPHDELLRQIASLPPRTALVYADYPVDVDGVPYEGDKVLAEVHAVGSAPIFSYIDSYFGRGIVGGPLLPVSIISRRSAEAAVRILAGENPNEVTTPPIGTGPPEFDSRELQRWNISKARLPVGSTVQFAEPTVWMKYRWQILTASIVGATQAVIIAWLLTERFRRRRAELESRRRLLEVAHLNGTVAASVLSASIAHELNQPLGAALSDTDTAEILLSAQPPDLEQVKEVVGHIRLANQRAAEIIQRLRKLLKRRSETDALDSDLNEAIRDAIEIFAPEAKRKGVVVEATGAERPLPVRADPVHLQQVILNLAVNAMEAMADVTPDSRNMAIRTALVARSNVEVSVIDSGLGIPNENLRDVFNTFYTTKAEGTGVGLSIARSIVEAYGGKIWAENGAKGGAIFRFTLPLVEPHPS